MSGYRFTGSRQFATPALVVQPAGMFQLGMELAIIKTMTQKQDAMTMAKPWPPAGSLLSHLREIVASFKHIAEIPTGYQDENGFHFGAEPVRLDNQLPLR
jgi:hypothetical protein